MSEQSEILTKSISKLRPWITFHGWLYIIVGIIYCISIIGLIIGIPLLIAGNGLLSSSNKLSNYSQEFQPEELVEALSGQKAFFMTTGILVILAIILPLVLTISLFLAMLFSPEVNKEIDLWTDKLPQITHSVSQPREI